MPLTLLLRIPDLSRFESATPAAWMLVEADGSLQKNGTSALAEAPAAERVVAIAPPARLLNLETALPAVSPAKRDALLRYAIEDKLTIDPATVHAVVLGRTQGAEHVVVAIERAWLQAALDWMKQAGRAPQQLISQADGVPVAGGEWAVLLDAPHGVARRADGFTYHFDVTPGLKPPFALGLALKEARDHQRGPARLTVYSAGGATLDAGLADAWSTSLGVPVALGKGNGDSVATYLAAARTSSLLTGEFASKSDGASWWPALKPALAMAALLLVAQTGLTAIDNFRLNREREALEGQMTQIFRTAFPAAQAVVDAPLQMSRNLQQAKRERGMAADDDARRTLAVMTRALQAVSPPPVVKALNIEAGVVTVDLELETDGQQESLRRALGNVHGAAMAPAAPSATGKRSTRVSVGGGS